MKCCISLLSFYIIIVVLLSMFCVFFLSFLCVWCCFHNGCISSDSHIFCPFSLSTKQTLYFLPSFSQSIYSYGLLPFPVNLSTVFFFYNFFHLSASLVILSIVFLPYSHLYASPCLLFLSLSFIIDQFIYPHLSPLAAPICLCLPYVMRKLR